MRLSLTWILGALGETLGLLGIWKGICTSDFPFMVFSGLTFVTSVAIMLLLFKETIRR